MTDRKEYFKQHYEENKEKLKAKYEENKEVIITRQKEYNEQNKESIKTKRQENKPPKSPRVLIDPATNPTHPFTERLAELFQESGTVYITKSGGVRHASIYIFAPESICQVLRTAIGGSISFNHRLHSHVWKCQGSNAIWFSKLIYPHLTGTQKDLAKFCVDFYQNAAPTPEKIVDERATYAIWLKRIKSHIEPYIPFHLVDMNI